MTELSWILVAVGGAGLLFAAVTFVRVTLPHHYGSNPGFGAFESSAAPWWFVLCVGLGLRAGSWRTGILTFVVGFLALGLAAQLLARLFGRRG